MGNDLVIKVRGSQALRICESPELLAAYRRDAERRSEQGRCNVYVVIEATGREIICVKCKDVEEAK